MRNTEQTYSGEGDSTTPNAPTANSATQTAQNQAQISNLQQEHKDALRELYITANSFFGTVTVKDSVDVLTDMFEEWIMTDYKLSCRTHDDSDLTYANIQLKAAFDTIRLISSLSKDVDKIWRLEGQLRLAKKEVSREQ